MGWQYPNHSRSPLLEPRVTLAVLIKCFTSLSSRKLPVSSLPHDPQEYLHKHAALYPPYAQVDTSRYPYKRESQRL